VIIRTSKRTRFVIFLVLVAAALAVVVSAWPVSQRGQAGTATQPVAAAIPVMAPSAPSTSGYFATARLEQQQAESRELALDQQVAADAAASATTRSNADSQVIALGRQGDQEAEIRAILLAKGYQDAVVYLSTDPAGAVVVVETANLTEADVARVADAVERVAGVPAGNISVMAHTG